MPRNLSRPLAQQGSLWYVASATLAAALGGLLFGLDTAVISGTVDSVKEQYHLSDLMEGWFVSSAILGCILGVVMAGKLSDALGRKKILLLSAVLFFISAIGCAVAPGVTVLISFRLAGGLGIGIASMLAPLYISEFTPPHLRGRMVVLYQLAIVLGVVGANLSNRVFLHLSHTDIAISGQGLYPWLQTQYRWLVVQEVWRSMLGFAALPALFFGSLVLTIPESPRWLVKQARSAEALEILARIGGEEVARQELAQIDEAIASEEGGLGQLLEPGWRIALLIGLALPFLSQVSGINAIVYYGPSILTKAGFDKDSAFTIQVIIGFMNALFTLAAILTVDKLGRRPLLLWGVSGVVAMLLAIGAVFHWATPKGYLLPTMIMLFTGFFNFSFGSVCWVIVSEIYPTRIRGRAMSLATLSLWIGCWLVSQMVPVMDAHLGMTGTFWLFALLCFPALLLTWKLIPETKGKSLEEIEKYWDSLRHRGREA